MKYDIIIIGAGPAGIYAAYELAEKDPQKKVLLLDKGRDIFKRRCPLMERKLRICPADACKPSCSITSGFGGAGAFSDGKFNITTEFGGWLAEYVHPTELLKLIRYVDDINLRHGAVTEITDPDTDAVRDIEQMAIGAGLKLLRSQVRHLGTEQNQETLKSIYAYLNGKIEMRFETEVADIIVSKTKHKVSGIRLKNGEEIRSDAVIAAPGRDGSAWLEEVFTKMGLHMSCNQVDVGVRAETSDIIMRDINHHLYEAKFIFNSSSGSKVRTFCANPSGYVVVENHSGIMAANGHAFRDAKRGSENTNFALLVSHTFTEPFNKPNEYAREICRRANDLSGGGVIVQRFGDIMRRRRSTEKRIKEGFIIPTLPEASPGDLGLVLPYNTMKSLIEMVQALDKITPGMASEHTLFYGVEAKFYSARPRLSTSLETEVAGLYCGGDGAGVTRGLAQAGAAGVWMARNILNRG